MSGRQAEGSRIKKLVMFRILLWWEPDGSKKTHTLFIFLYSESLLDIMSHPFEDSLWWISKWNLEEKLESHLQLRQQMCCDEKRSTTRAKVCSSHSLNQRLGRAEQPTVWNNKGKKPCVHPWNVCTRAQLQSPRARTMVWHGVAGSRRGGWRVGVGRRVIRNPEKPLNPAEFLSSSTAPLGRRQEPVERAR